jgi:hypothetical protein
MCPTSKRKLKIFSPEFQFGSILKKLIVKLFNAKSPSKPYALQWVRPTVGGHS